MCLESRFKDFWVITRPLRTMKFFRIALLVNLGLLIIGIIINYTPAILPGNDFGIYYQAALLARQDPAHLYNCTCYYYAFRYFPLFAFMFIGYSFINEVVANYIFLGLTFVINLINTMLIYYIPIKYYHLSEKSQHWFRILATLNLIFVPNVENYILGQINSFVAFCLLIVIICFEETRETDDPPIDLPNTPIKLLSRVSAWNLLGGILIGIAINLKPSLLLLVPFVLLVRIKFNTPHPGFSLKNYSMRIGFTQSIIRLIGIIALVLPNLFIFLAYPGMFTQFWAYNFFTGAGVLNQSFSIPRQIVNFSYLFGINTSVGLWMILIVVGFFVISFFFYLVRPNILGINAHFFNIAILISLLGY
jgi:hypothetical protein